MKNTLENLCYGKYGEIQITWWWLRQNADYDGVRIEWKICNEIIGKLPGKMMNQKKVTKNEIVSEKMMINSITDDSKEYILSHFIMIILLRWW